MIGTAPLRFLALVVGGWIGLRLVALAPGWWPPPSPDASPAPAPSGLPQASASREALPAPAEAVGVSTPAPFDLPATPAGIARATTPPLAARAVAEPSLVQVFLPAQVRQPYPPIRAPAVPPPPGFLAEPPLAAGLQLSPPRSAVPSRWSASAWLFFRRGEGGADLAPGGTLGGSQAGARLTYRINRDPRRPLALSARAYVPLDRPEGAEAALGVDWRPVAGLQVHLLAERRQRIGREGRSDFALSLYAGGEQRLLADRLHIEAYGQAGLVGLKERDPFADGSLRASLRAGPAQAGVGLWGGAQPGAARLDVGPQASARMTARGVGLRASAEWRFRIAGDAAPGSGPAFTLTAGF